MKKIPSANGVSFRIDAVRALLALVIVFATADGAGPWGALRADEGTALETDYTFPDVENWAGARWQVAGWPAIQLRKSRVGRSVVQLAFDSVSPYNTSGGPNFLLRVQVDGRFVFFTNSRGVAASKAGAILMRRKGRVFEGVLASSGTLTDAAVDYGRSTVHYTAGDLNPGNDNSPRFTSIRFVPRNAGAGVVRGGDGEIAVWEALSLAVPSYYGGPNWSVANWHGAQGKIIGSNAMVRIGFDAGSMYRGKTEGQNFLCRLVFKTGGAIFLTNSAEIARRKGEVVIMERKAGCFEAVVSGMGELKEAAIDFGESTLAFGRGTWSLNEKNTADVRFNSLEILPAAASQPGQSAQPAPEPSAPPAAQTANPAGGAQQTKAEYSTPAYYGGRNWLVAVFTGARGLKLSGKNTSLRLHFDNASCFNTGGDAGFLLRVVFENGKTIYASNSAKIATAASSEKTAAFTLNKTGRYFEGALAGLANGGIVKEIAVDFGESTSHLPVPLNARNNNNPRFTKLTVLE